MDRLVRRVGLTASRMVPHGPEPLMLYADTPTVAVGEKTTGIVS